MNHVDIAERVLDDQQGAVIARCRRRLGAALGSRRTTAVGYEHHAFFVIESHERRSIHSRRDHIPKNQS